MIRGELLRVYSVLWVGHTEDSNLVTVSNALLKPHSRHVGTFLTPARLESVAVTIASETNW